jgi:two-component system, chemotaxis family, CheB/CheR fusion protein
MEDFSATPPLPESPPDASDDVRIEPAPDHVEVELASETDNPVPTRAFATLPMVGLGGSAGGLAALQSFFAGAPTDGGLAYVVVMHLAAEHESALPQILQRCSRSTTASASFRTRSTSSRRARR